MHISEIKRMYPQYPNEASNLTYPRKEKKNDGDFKEVLDVEIKRWNQPTKAMIPSNWGCFSRETKEK